MLHALLALLPLLASAHSNLSEGNPGLDLAPTLFQRDSIKDVGLGGTRTLALTLDDGPTDGVTDQVLDTLRKHSVKAVFFVNGAKIPGRERLLKRMFAEGHLVANHTENHKNLHGRRYWNNRNLIRDLTLTHEKIRPYLRSTDLWLFRAPYGNWNARFAAVLNKDPVLKRYIGPMYWNIGEFLSEKFSADWDCWERGVDADRCLGGYIAETEERRGGIVLMHDRYFQTAQMLDRYIEAMKARGYRFLRLDSLKALRRYQ